MKRFVEGADRDQPRLFPECLEAMLTHQKRPRGVQHAKAPLSCRDLHQRRS